MTRTSRRITSETTPDIETDIETNIRTLRLWLQAGTRKRRPPENSWETLECTFVVTEIIDYVFFLYVCVYTLYM